MNSRGFTRVEFSECASVLLDDDVIFGDLKNVSLKGMFLQTSHNIPLNTEVVVKVYDSNNSSISVQGLVVRNEKTGIGIQILKLDVDSFVRLRNLIIIKCNNYNMIMKETYKMSNCIH